MHGNSWAARFGLPDFHIHLGCTIRTSIFRGKLCRISRHGCNTSHVCAHACTDDFTIIRDDLQESIRDRTCNSCKSGLRISWQLISAAPATSAEWQNCSQRFGNAAGRILRIPWQDVKLVSHMGRADALTLSHLPKL